MTDNTMCEEFEKWAVSEGMRITRGYYYDVYESVETKAAYLAWQAARTVPVEDVVLPIASAYESGIGHCNDGLCNPYKEGSAEAYAYDYGKEFGKSRATKHSVGDAIPHVAVVGEPDCYDAGLLGDFGGGNVEWWQDYIRAELARAHDFYASQWPSASVPVVSNVVGYLAGGTLMRRKIQGYACKPLVVQPTHSITAAELATLREKAAEADELRKDAERYRKLRGWMSSNVKEGWGRVTDLSAVFCYVSWQEGDSYLDNLPECNVGLMQKAN